LITISIVLPLYTLGAIFNTPYIVALKIVAWIVINT